MLRKTIKYVDYNDVSRTEDFHFNLTRAEIMEMELGVDGGLSAILEKMVKTQDVKNIVGHFKQIIMKSYGEKSPDGKQFIKSPELSKAFSETEAYSELFLELMSDPDKAAAFVNAIVPANLAEKASGQVIPLTTPQ